MRSRTAWSHSPPRTASRWRPASSPVASRTARAASSARAGASVLCASAPSGTGVDVCRRRGHVPGGQRGRRQPCRGLRRGGGQAQGLGECVALAERLRGLAEPLLATVVSGALSSDHPSASRAWHSAKGDPASRARSTARRLPASAAAGATFVQVEQREQDPGFALHVMEVELRCRRNALVQRGARLCCLARAPVDVTDQRQRRRGALAVVELAYDGQRLLRPAESPGRARYGRPRRSPGCPRRRLRRSGTRPG